MGSWYGVQQTIQSCSNLRNSSTTINFQIYSINISHPLKQYISTTQDTLVTTTFIYML